MTAFIYVDRGHPSGPCRIPLNKHGQPQAYYGRIGRERAHRAAWQEAYGPIPAGHQVRHVCRAGRPCCEPTHLTTGTAKDNAVDRLLHGVQVRGSAHGEAKLTEDTVTAIIALLAEGMPQWVIGECFGVRQMTVWRIRARNTWRHVWPAGFSWTPEGGWKREPRPGE